MINPPGNTPYDVTILEIKALEREHNITFSDSEKSEIASRITIYQKTLLNRSLSEVCMRIYQAILHIFCKSDWQLAHKTVKSALEAKAITDLNEKKPSDDSNSTGTVTTYDDTIKKTCDLSDQILLKLTDQKNSKILNAGDHLELCKPDFSDLVSNIVIAQRNATSEETIDLCLKIIGEKPEAATIILNNYQQLGLNGATPEKRLALFESIINASDTETCQNLFTKIIDRTLDTISIEDQLKLYIMLIKKPNAPKTEDSQEFLNQIGIKATRQGKFIELAKYLSSDQGKDIPVDQNAKMCLAIVNAGDRVLDEFIRHLDNDSTQLRLVERNPTDPRVIVKNYAKDIFMVIIDKKRDKPDAIDNIIKLIRMEHRYLSINDKHDLINHAKTPPSKKET